MYMIIGKKGAAQGMQPKRSMPRDGYRFAIQWSTACMVALLALLITPFESVEADEKKSKFARELIEAETTFSCSGGTNGSNFFVYPGDKHLVIESVGIIVQANPESQLSANLHIYLPDPKEDFMGTDFLYPITLNKATFKGDPALSGTLNGPIFAQPGTSVGIQYNRGKEAVPECKVKASLSGYLLPVRWGSSVFPIARP